MLYAHEIKCDISSDLRIVLTGICVFDVTLWVRTYIFCVINIDLFLCELLHAKVEWDCMFWLLNTYWDYKTAEYNMKMVEWEQWCVSVLSKTVTNNWSFFLTPASFWTSAYRIIIEKFYCVFVRFIINLKFLNNDVTFKHLDIF